MYTPEYAREEDAARLIAFMRQYGFGTLISSSNGRPIATSLPFVVYGSQKDKLVLRGHIARENRQWEFMAEGAEVLALFQGPHGYISPAWYSRAISVPTWNYASVEACGRFQYITDQDTIIHFLTDLWSNYESGAEESLASLPEKYLTSLLKEIVCFEIQVTRLEGTFKLSQNKPEKDRLNIIHELEKSSLSGDALLARLMREEEER